MDTNDTIETARAFPDAVITLKQSWSAMTIQPNLIALQDAFEGACCGYIFCIPAYCLPL
jgi:hypothetical protein